MYRGIGQSRNQRIVNPYCPSLKFLIMNIYKKFCPHVFLAKCKEKHKKGEEIILTTRHGKENRSIVHNLIYEKEGFYYYSITRADGFNTQERAKRKSEKYEVWANVREKKSDEFFEASQEGKDFLSLGEPIKVGHHSERRHRALIERNHNRMRKSVENQDKARKHASKADYWRSKIQEINLSMPDSLDYFAYKLGEAKIVWLNYKNHPEQRPHQYALTYARKKVRELEKKLELAEKLWK